MPGISPEDTVDAAWFRMPIKAIGTLYATIIQRDVTISPAVADRTLTLNFTNKSHAEAMRLIEEEFARIGVRIKDIDTGKVALVATEETAGAGTK